VATASVVVAHGINCGEGPVWRPASADLVVTSVMDGLLWRIDPGTGAKEVVADTGGGANSAAPCTDGGFLVCNNGGLDFTAFADVMATPVVNPPRYRAPAIQRTRTDGTVVDFCGIGLLTSPNDLVVDAQGDIWFTDPHFDPGANLAAGRVFRYRGNDSPSGERVGKEAVDGSGRLELWDSFDHYLNGIGVAPDGRIVTAERSGLRWLDPATGERGWLAQKMGGHGDGFAFDADGRAYVCLPAARQFVVVDTDGSVVEKFDLPAGAITLNCCFGGADLRTLFVTDAGNATVLAFEAMPTPGREVYAYAGDSAT